MQKEEQKITDKIYRFGKKKLLFELTGSVLFLLLILIIIWLSAALADNLVYFSEITRWGLLSINTVLISYLLFKFLFYPLKRLIALKKHSDLSQTAGLIGRMYPEIKDRLVNTYQLVSRSPDENTSDALHREAVKSNLAQFRNRNFSAILKIKSFLPAPVLSVVVLISFIVLTGLMYNDLLHASKRLLNPSNEYKILPAYRFVVEPGDTQITKGQSLTLNARYRGPLLEACYLYLWTPDNPSVSRVLEMNLEDSTYSAAIKDIIKSQSYQIRGVPMDSRQYENTIFSEQFTIDVRIPPMIETLDVELIPPAYSGLPRQFPDRNIGDIAALAGTIVRLKVSTNHAVQSAQIQFKSGKTVPSDIRGELLNGQFQIRQNDNYSIILNDTQGLQNQNPIEYQIALLPDNPPFIEITEPGRDVEIQLDAAIRLKMEGSDDFGIGRVKLYYKFLRQSKTATDTNWQHIVLPLQAQSDNRFEIFHYWDFNKLPLAFNDGIKYYAHVEDNNSVTGPGIGKSETYYIRFPSLDEIFDSFAEKEAEEIDNLEEVNKESEELKKSLEEIQRELKRESKLDWEKKQQLESALEKQKELQDKVEEIQKNIEELVNKLDANNLISEEILEKYSQLQELFREVITPEMMESLQNLQEALEKPDQENIRQAMQQFKLNQEVFKERIERTMELLKQVQLEQRMDELVQKAKKLKEQQEKISEQLNKELEPDEGEYEQLKAQQEQQAEKLNNLEKSLESMLREPRVAKFQETMQQLDSARQQIGAEDLQNEMGQMQQSLEQNNRQQAGQHSEKLRQNFAGIQNQLQQAQSQMMNQNKQQVMQKMASAMQKMLKLSHEQEKLQRETQRSSDYSSGFKDIAAEQAQLKNNFRNLISDLVQLSKETFFVNPELSRSMAKSMRNMDQSLSNLSERNRGASASNQEKALGGLNESIQMMHESMSSLSQSQSGTGFNQFLEQLQQMAGQQGQINEQTMSLLQKQGNQGSLMMREQARRKRLAAEQAALQQAMEGMQKGMGNRQDVLGRMNEIAAEMEKVVEDLIKNNVDRKTIERQRKILSRMLDAQKSVREREFSKKRKAETAKAYLAKDPGELRNLTDLDKKAIEEALRRALNEGYNRDYQKLIEAYFNKLIRSKEE